MSAILISILKWFVITVIIPIVEKWVAAKVKVQKKVSAYKEKKKNAVKNAEEYEKNPTDDTRNDLP